MAERRFRGEADMHRGVARTASVAYDPKRTSGLENRGQSAGIRLDEIFGNEMLCKADVSGND